MTGKAPTDMVSWNPVTLQHLIPVFQPAISVKYRPEEKTQTVRKLSSLKYWLIFCLLLISFRNTVNQRGYAYQGPGETPVLLNREIPRYLTARDFRQALVQPFSASWSNVGIRAIIQRIRETQNISIILDRRIDPAPGAAPAAGAGA